MLEKRFLMPDISAVLTKTKQNLHDNAPLSWQGYYVQSTVMSPSTSPSSHQILLLPIKAETKFQ